MYKVDNKKDYSLGEISGLREFYYGQDGFADWIRDKLSSEFHFDPFDSSDVEYAVRRARFCAYSEVMVEVSDSLRNLNERYEADLKEATVKDEEAGN